MRLYDAMSEWCSYLRQKDMAPKQTVLPKMTRAAARSTNKNLLTSQSMSQAR